ncbi:MULTISPECIES: glycosyl hydrolase family 8 [Paenibacillus]|uniref:Oligosaccharide reducing-end xylanase n=1 Tax=Paenibacillus pabuli TaxID=1472 RepID=A0A855XST5_9BACL|nr:MULTISPECIES: glycosyl hydrolase family 8 [Paenibacillus]PWW36216.1 oligosaccharide reducing-end xylanase [Paenibacillus pabuli]PXW03295.1 oligosaccharide reducing-end xylanase [Paenibacillus taichungensis]
MTITDKGAFYTGTYRNLFLELGYDDSEIAEKLEKAWTELFYGDDDTRIYYPMGEDKGYVLDTGNLDVRSEGMSYGMMMAVQMDKKEEFNRLWNFSKTYMQHTEGRYKDYFAWHCKPDGTRISQGPAPDGEEFFAMALFFASNRWGDGPEPYDYAVQARKILRACVHQGENGVGDPMWDPETKLIKFIPESPFSDPSYHLPHFYELFAKYADECDQSFWNEAAAESRAYLHKACHPVTGLSPEYSNFDGTPAPPQRHGDFRHFYSDAYRVAANIALDWEWFHKDRWQVEQSNHIQAFFSEIEVSDYRRYTIEGQPFDELSLHPIGLLATNAMASLAADGPHANPFVHQFWNTPLRQGVRRYYDNCLYFFSLLALSGRYRMY